MAIPLVHPFLRHEMQHGNDGQHRRGNGNLILRPVKHRVDTGIVGGEDRPHVARTPVQTHGRGDGRRRRQAADTQADQNREGRDHQQHGQPRGAVDRQAEEHAEHPGAGHDDVGRAQGQQRTDGQLDQRPAGTDLVHVAGKTADGHDVEAQPGRPRTQGFFDEFKGIEENQPGTFLGRKNGAQPQSHGGEHQHHAGKEQNGLRLVTLHDQPASPEGDDQCNDDTHV